MSALLKRLFDIVAAAALLLIAFPFLLLIAVAIKCASEGPALFTQTRIGLHGQRFSMVKFRTMAWNAPDLRNPDGSTFNSDRDPRVTSIGRILRRTSVDEIPQLWNVLRGEMSLVGPRPELPDGPSTYQPSHFRRLNVRPGMTGWAAIHGRNEVPVSVRRDLDVWYAGHANFFIDMKILYRTIKLVAGSRGIHRAAGASAPHPSLGESSEAHPCSSER